MGDTLLRRRIKDFSFDRCNWGNQGFKRLCLQLFGYMGHGKSSFINTCKYVWDNTEFIEYAEAADGDGGITKERRTYQLTENITLVDNRGCLTMNSNETGEIFAQLGNLLPLDNYFEWNKGFEVVDRIVEAEINVKPSDFIVPMFVYRVTKSIDPRERDELKELFDTTTRMTEITPIVILTHKKHQDGKLSVIEKIFRDIGTYCIFSLENYTLENHVKTSEIHESVINILFEVVKDAEFRGNQPRNPKEEMTKRKLFVFNYIHNKVLHNQRMELESQKALENVSFQREMKFTLGKEEKRQQREKEKQEEEMKRLQREFERQSLQDQFEHQKRMEEIASRASRKSKSQKKGRKSK